MDPSLPTPAAVLLAERIGAVRLPAVRGRAHHRATHPPFGPDVACVVTGAGIGAVLAHLRAGRVPARLVWVVASPRDRFGDALVDEVLAAACRPMIWDTARLGAPDLVRLAYAAYASAGAEALYVVDRDRARDLVRALGRRGVRAFGALPSTPDR